MAIRLNARKIRQAQNEVKASYPQGGTIKGWYEDLNVPDRQVYEANVFKKPTTVWRRVTKINHKRVMPDYFTFEPHEEKKDGGTE